MFQNLNPMDRPTAILEILIMLAVAFIIGFIIAWLLRKNKKEVVTQTIDNSDELDSLNNKLKQLEGTYSQTAKDLDSARAELEECRSSAKAAVEIPKSEPLPAAESVVEKATIEATDQANAARLGFEVASADDKDDLTKIKGVGPFIEKKLNGLGIYTFKQISGFNNDTIEKVTEAIEFFPGRIQRDNWVSQAGDLHAQKTT